MSKKPVLYYVLLSPPCRSVLLTAAALGVELELKEIDLLGLEHLKPEFVEINPQHTLPFLDDNGAHIADSHAICTYLCEKYGKDDKLYPKDLAKRTLVDSRLHFDSGHLFCRIRYLYEPVFYHKGTEFPQEKIEYMRSQWAIMEGFLQNSKYLCGNELTIADLCCVASVTSVNEIVTIDGDKYPKFVQWIERLSQLPYYEEMNGIGARGVQEGVRQARQKNAEAAQAH